MSISFVDKYQEDVHDWELLEEIQRQYAKVRESREAHTSTKTTISLAAARDNKVEIRWEGYLPPRPRRLGVEVFDDYPIHELTEYIDWGPLFKAWELKGRYPDIFNDPDFQPEPAWPIEVYCFAKSVEACPRTRQDQARPRQPT